MKFTYKKKKFQVWKEFKDFLSFSIWLTKVCSKPSIDCLRAKALILRPFGADDDEGKRMKEKVVDGDGDWAQWKRKFKEMGKLKLS